MSLSQKTKESIADALAVAIQDAAVAASIECRGKPTHYGVRVGGNGHVIIRYACWTDGEHPGEGWIPLQE